MDSLYGRKIRIDILGKQQRERPTFNGANPLGTPKIKGASDHFGDNSYFQAELNIGK